MKTLLALATATAVLAAIPAAAQAKPGHGWEKHGEGWDKHGDDWDKHGHGWQKSNYGQERSDYVHRRNAARKAWSQGYVVPRGYGYYSYNRIPRAYVSRYRLEPNYRYAYRNNRVYVVNPNTYAIERILGGW